jgi:hypothetical protein
MSENPDIRKQEQAEAFRGEEWLEVEDVKRWFKDKASVAPTHIFYPLTKRMHPIDLPGSMAWPHPEDCPHCLETNKDQRPDEKTD